MEVGLPLFVVKLEVHDGRLMGRVAGELVPWYALPAGAMWRCRCHGGEGWQVSLPNDAGAWCTLDTTTSGAGWEVTGEAPALTVTPSINAVGAWHGFISNGVLIDA